MAKSKFEYVRQFEVEDRLMPNCWVVVRVDGKGFHRFCDAHHYMKPNDERGLNLMNRAAQGVMEDMRDVVLSFGHSDEFSFLFHRNTVLHNRRASKVVAAVSSLFSSSFTLMWPRYFHSQPLQWAPCFEASLLAFPQDSNLRDYLSWRQADCHMNNLYNTCFWKLVQDRGMSQSQAQERLKGTLSSDKNELLVSDFKVNYNTLPEQHRKGTILIRQETSASDPPSGRSVTMAVNNHHHQQQHNARTAGPPPSPSITVLHTDLIGPQFWEQHPSLLAPRKSL